MVGQFEIAGYYRVIFILNYGNDSLTTEGISYAIMQFTCVRMLLGPKFRDSIGKKNRIHGRLVT